MKIDNQGKPQYGPRPRGSKKPDGSGDWVFWACVAIIIVALVAGAL